MTSFIDIQPGGSASQQVSIRGLLRDTALLVTTLAQGGKAESVTVLRQRCRQLMSEFSAALEQRMVAPDIMEDALDAQCGLLDEAVLRSLPTDDKSLWDAQPLQVERNGRHDAGERLFDRLTQRMRETPPNADLLQCYAAILGLGFMGRYAREGQSQRSSLMASLDSQLETLRPAVARTFVADRHSWRPADWLYRLSPWVIAGFGFLTAALVYLIWSQALDLQLAQLIPSLPPKP